MGLIKIKKRYFRDKYSSFIKNIPPINTVSNLFKMRLLKASIVIFLIGCSTFSQDYKELIVGTWMWQSISEENDFYSKAEAISEFREDGFLYITVNGFMRIGEKEVVFKYYDKSKWDIIGDIYTENTLEEKLLEIEGNHELQQIIKDSYLSKDYKSTNTGKIIKIDNNVCILSSEVESGEKEILKLIRLK